MGVQFCTSSNGAMQYAGGNFPTNMLMRDYGFASQKPPRVQPVSPASADARPHVQVISRDPCPSRGMTGSSV